MEAFEGQGPDQQITQPKVERVTVADLKTIIPDVGGSVFVLQRNAKDKENRKFSPDSPNFGALDLGEAEATYDQAREFFVKVFGNLSPEERKNIDVLVVASDASLKMPDNKTSPHKRAVETAEQVLEAAVESMDEFGISQTQLLNKPQGQESSRILGLPEQPDAQRKPIEISSGRLKDLKMFEDSPEFVKYMTDRYGNGQEFWNAYEDDRERDVRIQMKAEGPIEIADRVGHYMGTLDNAMKLYHESHPGRRVIVWAVSHYDSISPFLKQHVTGQPLQDYLPVDNRGGVVFSTNQNGERSSVQIQDRDYRVTLGALAAKPSK